ncbi:hypothetical protein LJB99_03095 [Deltaproteobacteria bacterium OttesenSCG-928-K17]|nr:hypothetical protein [Deltaproteobacteria bacterium OttesenSCG-928-K17]
MRRIFIGAIIAAMLVCAPAWAAGDKEDQVLATPFTALISFGDSFSDNGFADGHGFKRYCEAWTWVEYLAQMLNLPHDNHAWGGAMSDDRNCNHAEGVRWSGLNWQVDEYVKSLDKGQDISKVLFTVMCGSNDVWLDITDGKVSAGNIRQAMANLAKAGARHIVYRETPAALMAPGYLDGKYASYSEPWAKLVNDTNAITRKELVAGFKKEFPEVTIYYMESDPLFTKIKNGDEGFKFEIHDKAWWGTYSLPEPGKYVWYDEWHPTSFVHKLIAEDSVEVLKKSVK